MYQGKGAWFFVTLPPEEAAQIKFMTSHRRRGWGSVRVKVIIGDTQWETSIFPYQEVTSYILPIKATIRKKENITAGDAVTVSLIIF